MKFLKCFCVVLFLSILLISQYSYVFDIKITPQESNENEKTSHSSAISSWDYTSLSEWLAKAHVEGNFIQLVIGVNDSEYDHNKLFKLIGESGGNVKNTITIRGKTEAIVANIPLNTALHFIVQAKEISRYVEPNLKFQITHVPNDPNWNLQWALSKIEAEYAWNVTFGNHSVLVAVVDTGIDWTHPDLAVNYVPLGYDWVNDDSDPMDDHGHGTHVAGIIGAVINNGIGIAGLAQVRIMAEKALDRYGYGLEEDLANAIIHAVDVGACIISNSWGGDSDSKLIHNAIKYAYERGALVIAAAGNLGSSQKFYPAAYEEVIAVAATDQYDKRAYFSNFGDWVELAAPGVNIYSTIPGSYAYKSGTSMAAPHVSGVAALVWSRFPAMKRDQVRLYMRSVSDDVGAAGFDVYYGYGRINARRAAEEGLPLHDVMIFDVTEPPFVEPAKASFINVTIFNFGASTETNIVVHLEVNGSLIDEKVINALESGAKATLTFQLNPVETGKYNIASYVLPLAGETNIENNYAFAFVHVGYPLKVAVLDSAGTDYDTAIWEELNANWEKFGDRMIYVDYTTLNKNAITYEDINSTSAEVLIISNAFAWEFTDAEIDAITSYVLEGHGLIATSGTFHSSAPNNKKLASLFGINGTIDYNVALTDLLHIKEEHHPLLTGIPNPYVFKDVGATVPEDGIWDSNELIDGTYLALGHNGECAIIEHKGLIYISPWLEIIPSYYQFHLQLFYNAIIWSRYQRPEHEVIVKTECPLVLNPGRTAVLNATCINKGLNNEANVELQILINNTVVASSVISQLNVDSGYTLSYQWTPAIEGTYNITVYVIPIPGEENTANNKNEFTVPVYQTIFAIFQNKDPWGAKANENALKTLGIPYIVLGSQHFGLIDLTVFSKVIIASDQDQKFYNDLEIYRWWLEDYVSNFGGRLEIHAADAGSNGGFWNGPIPGNLTWTRTFSNFITILDNLHPVVNIPNAINNTEIDMWFYSSHGNFQNYPSEACMIAKDDSTGRPVYLEFRYGMGVIVVTSMTLEWGYEKGYSKMLENSLLYSKSEHELVVTLETPEYVKIGNQAWLNITIYNKGLATETNMEVLLLVNGTIANNTIIEQILSDAILKISVLWAPTEEGTYNITAFIPPVPGELDLQNNYFTRFVVVKDRFPGDVNGDGRVDYWDLYYLGKSYGKQQDDPQYNPEADFNRDGKINFLDLYIIGINYGKRAL